MQQWTSVLSFWNGKQMMLMIMMLLMLLLLLWIVNNITSILHYNFRGHVSGVRWTICACSKGKRGARHIHMHQKCPKPTVINLHAGEELVIISFERSTQPTCNGKTSSSSFTRQPVINLLLPFLMRFLFLVGIVEVSRSVHWPPSVLLTDSANHVPFGVIRIPFIVND